MQIKHFALILLASTLVGCANTLDKLEQVGKQPDMNKVEDPTQAPNYQEMSWPLPKTPQPEGSYVNSLWQPGSRAFFRDQRAARVGDVLRVKVKIENKAELDNETERKRDSGESLAAPNIFGLEGKIFKPIPGTANLSKLADVTSNTNSKGTGNIKRKETIETMVAALIIQVLPNGNFVIDGTQELRINYEIREVSVKGVVRPQDIGSDNTVDSSQIAQARITYGGRGQLSDMQQPRWGSQVLDILAPF